MKYPKIDKAKISYGIIGIMLMAGIAYRIDLISRPEGGKVLGLSDIPAVEGGVSVPVETVGGDQVNGAEDAGVSWPGEIVSLGNLEVQPEREGTIVEWKVRVGQEVLKGQTLGNLSAPPKTPELIRMLAEQTESLAQAKGQAQATTEFTKKNIEQLNTLQDTLKNNLAAIDSVLSSLKGEPKNDIPTSSISSLKQLENVAEAKQRNLRKIIEQILNKQILKFTNALEPKYFHNGNVRDEFGLLDLSVRNNYAFMANKLSDELNNPDTLPASTALDYTQAAIKLLTFSVAGESLPQSSIDEYRKMANEDQMILLDASKEYEEAKSELAMKEFENKTENVNYKREYRTADIDYELSLLEQQKDYAEQIKEINEKIAMLEKDNKMASVEVEASEASYAAVSRSIMEGLAIVSPQDGTISAVYKKNGDFVEPGMPVASINTGDEKQHFVRFHIPSNVPVPESGTILMIMKPGYPSDGKKIKLIGTGTALGEKGAYVADAELVDPIDWPVGISVRVMPPHGFITSTLISFPAVWWDEKAQANVWLVTEEGKIRPQPIRIGKTIGDKIEVIEGLQQGNRYVSKVINGLTQGMTLKDVKMEENQDSEQKGKAMDMESMGH